MALSGVAARTSQPASLHPSPSRVGPGIGEDGSHPGVGVSLEGGVDVGVFGVDLAPIHDGGDPRLGRPEQTNQGGGVQVIGRVAVGVASAGSENLAMSPRLLKIDSQT